MARDYYETLGVPRGASEREIKTAYRRLAKELHPDCCDNDPAKEARFKEVSEAYAVLSDAERRPLYDQFGEAGVQGGGCAGVGGVDFETVMRGVAGGFGASFELDFEEIFGGGRRRARNRRHPGRDLTLTVRVPMLDALRGCQQRVSYRPSKGGPTQEVDVTIPSGSRSGDNLRIRGAGANGSGARPGDLAISLEVIPHPGVRWEGEAVVMDLPVSCLEAYRGAKIDLETPQGRVVVRVPPGCRSGQKLRLRGKGPRRKGRTIDLILRLCVELPPAGSTEVVEAFEKVERSYGNLRCELPKLS